MFAIIQTGGKQYKVQKGDIVEVEKLHTNQKKVSFDEILMVDDKAGTPFVKGAKVTADVMGDKKNPKVIIFKKKRRKNFRRKTGHRQQVMVLKITDITV